MNNARLSAEIVIELLVALLAFLFWGALLRGEGLPPRRWDTPTGYQGP